MRLFGLFPIRINMEIWTLKSVERTPWTGDQPCHKEVTYTDNRRQISMPRVGLEPMVPVFERENVFNALASGIQTFCFTYPYMSFLFNFVPRKLLVSRSPVVNPTSGQDYSVISRNNIYIN
jgi:hypothetical protein